jgi:hypothetical protein
LVLGVSAARVWQDIQTHASKTLGILALIASTLITIALVGPDHGRLLLNFRDGISLWLEWANDVVDLPKGLPSLFRDDRTQLWLKVAIWGAAVMTWWIVLRVIESIDSHRLTSSTAAQGGPTGPHYISKGRTHYAPATTVRRRRR